MKYNVSHICMRLCKNSNFFHQTRKYKQTKAMRELNWQPFNKNMPFSKRWYIMTNRNACRNTLSHTLEMLVNCLCWEGDSSSANSPHHRTMKQPKLMLGLSCPVVQGSLTILPYLSAVSWGIPAGDYPMSFLKFSKK